MVYSNAYMATSFVPCYMFMWRFEEYTLILLTVNRYVFTVTLNGHGPSSDYCFGGWEMVITFIVILFLE